MFCGKCGTQNSDSAEFCANCGAKLSKGASAQTVAIPSGSQNDKNRKVGIIAVAAAAVVVVILGIILFGGRGYKATAEAFLDAQFAADAEAIFELIPQEMIDYAMEQEGYDDEDYRDLVNELEDTIQNQLDDLDAYLGVGWTASYEIVDSEDIDGSDFDDIVDAYEEEADIQVSAAKTVEAEITITADETESNVTQDLALIKVGRSWYIDVLRMGSLF